MSVSSLIGCIFPTKVRQLKHFIMSVYNRQTKHISNYTCQTLVNLETVKRERDFICRDSQSAIRRSVTVTFVKRGYHSNLLQGLVGRYFYRHKTEGLMYPNSICSTVLFLLRKKFFFELVIVNKMSTIFVHSLNYSMLCLSRLTVGGIHTYSET